MGIGVNGAYIAQADVFDECRVHVHPLDHLLQQLHDHAIERCILEAAFS
jgi:hypothetical protein